MVNKIYLNSRFALRSDTLDNWQSKNPVLEDGEPSVVSNGSETEWLKIGDGVTDWNNLPYKLGPMGPQGVQGNKGEKGDKGDKGSDGLTPEADQTYNPESPNAQSGIAVAEALGYEVIGDITLTESTNIVSFTENISNYKDFLFLFEGTVAQNGTLRFSTGFNLGTAVYFANNISALASALATDTYFWWNRINFVKTYNGTDYFENGFAYNVSKVNNDVSPQSYGDSSTIRYGKMARRKFNNFFIRTIGQYYAIGSRFILMGRK